MRIETERENSEYTIRAAGREDLRVIAEIHRSAFPGFFLTDMGRGFLRGYYSTTLKYDGAVLLLAESDRNVVGFVSGFVDPARFSQTLSRAKWQLLPAIAWAILCNPRLVGRVLDNVQRVSAAETPQHASSAKTCELASIGILEHEQGRGVGKALVKAFVEHAANLGATNIMLTTDATGNNAGNAFYRGLGFEQSRQFRRSANRIMNEYVYWISRKP